MKARDSRSHKPNAGRGDRRRRPPAVSSTHLQDHWGRPVRTPSEPKPMQLLRGIAVSPGIAIGPLQVIDPQGQRLPQRTDRKSVV